MLKEEFLKKYNITSIYTIAEKNFAPMFFIKFEDGTLDKFMITREDLVKMSDPYSFLNESITFREYINKRRTNLIDKILE